MKQASCLLVLLFCIFSLVYPQTNGSFFTLQLGKQTCLFKYEQKPDSILVDVDSMHCTQVFNVINPVTLIEVTRFFKDTVVLKKSLILQDNNYKSIHTKSLVGIDTLVTVNPVDLTEEVKVISNHDPQYHVETEMSYFDFLLLLKTKFELKNPQKKLHVYSFEIYYETSDTSGLIEIKYPQTIEGVISKLNCLANGGFILLSLKADDHNLVNIDTHGGFLALIHIRK